MKSVYIVSMARTAIGSIGGALKNIQAENLLACTLKETIARSNLESALIDEVICGQAKQSTDAPNIARIASLLSDIPEHIPSYTVHRQCASGLQAILSGAQQIQCGYSDVVLVGGAESMSTAPFYIRNARFGVGNGNTEFIDPNTESQPRSQPQDKYGIFTMINTADNVARQYNISREAQDEFAWKSQRKAIAAINKGYFKDEIVPVIIPQRKKDPIFFEVDEYPKSDTNLEKLAKLRPIYTDGFVTAGNASGRNDGGAAMMLVSEDIVNRYNLTPLARVMAGAAAGVDPKMMGMGPVAATQKLLQSAALKKLTLNDFGLFEINEAFAAQALACIQELHIDPEKVNVNGGAIALGHPLGCTGTRISITLLQEMKRQKVKYGIANLCVAGGLGMALAFECL